MKSSNSNFKNFRKLFKKNGKFRYTSMIVSLAMALMAINSKFGYKNFFEVEAMRDPRNNPYYMRGNQGQMTPNNRNQMPPNNRNQMQMPRLNFNQQTGVDLDPNHYRDSQLLGHTLLANTQVMSPNNMTQGIASTSQMHPYNGTSSIYRMPNNVSYTNNINYTNAGNPFGLNTISEGNESQNENEQYNNQENTTQNYDLNNNPYTIPQYNGSLSNIPQSVTPQFINPQNTPQGQRFPLIDLGAYTPTDPNANSNNNYVTPFTNDPYFNYNNNTDPFGNVNDDNNDNNNDNPYASQDLQTEEQNRNIDNNNNNDNINNINNINNSPQLNVNTTMQDNSVEMNNTNNQVQTTDLNTSRRGQTTNSQVPLLNTMTRGTILGPNSTINQVRTTNLNTSQRGLTTTGQVSLLNNMTRGTISGPNNTINQVRTNNLNTPQRGQTTNSQVPLLNTMTRGTILGPNSTINQVRTNNLNTSQRGLTTTGQVPLLNTMTRGTILGPNNTINQVRTTNLNTSQRGQTTNSQVSLLNNMTRGTISGPNNTINQVRTNKLNTPQRGQTTNSQVSLLNTMTRGTILGPNNTNNQVQIPNPNAIPYGQNPNGSVSLLNNMTRGTISGPNNTINQVRTTNLTTSQRGQTTNSQISLLNNMTRDNRGGLNNRINPGQTTNLNTSRRGQTTTGVDSLMGRTLQNQNMQQTKFNNVLPSQQKNSNAYIANASRNQQNQYALVPYAGNGNVIANNGRPPAIDYNTLLKEMPKAQEAMNFFDLNAQQITQSKDLTIKKFSAVDNLNRQLQNVGKLIETTRYYTKILEYLSTLNDNGHILLGLAAHNAYLTSDAINEEKIIEALNNQIASDSWFKTIVTLIENPNSEILPIIQEIVEYTSENDYFSIEETSRNAEVYLKHLGERIKIVLFTNYVTQFINTGAFYEYLCLKYFYEELAESEDVVKGEDLHLLGYSETNILNNAKFQVNFLETLFEKYRESFERFLKMVHADNYGTKISGILENNSYEQYDEFNDYYKNKNSKDENKGPQPQYQHVIPYMEDLKDINKTYGNDGLLKFETRLEFIKEFQKLFKGKLVKSFVEEKSARHAGNVTTTAETDLDITIKNLNKIATELYYGNNQKQPEYMLYNDKVKEIKGWVNNNRNHDPFSTNHSTYLHDCIDMISRTLATVLKNYYRLVQEIEVNVADFHAYVSDYVMASKKRKDWGSKTDFTDALVNLGTRLKKYSYQEIDKDKFETLKKYIMGYHVNSLMEIIREKGVELTTITDKLKNELDRYKDLMKNSAEAEAEFTKFKADLKSKEEELKSKANLENSDKNVIQNLNLDIEKAKKEIAKKQEAVNTLVKGIMDDFNKFRTLVNMARTQCMKVAAYKYLLGVTFNALRSVDEKLSDLAYRDYSYDLQKIFSTNDYLFGMLVESDNLVNSLAGRYNLQNKLSDEKVAENLSKIMMLYPKGITPPDDIIKMLHFNKSELLSKEQIAELKKLYNINSTAYELTLDSYDSLHKRADSLVRDIFEHVDHNDYSVYALEQTLEDYLNSNGEQPQNIEEEYNYYSAYTNIIEKFVEWIYQNRSLLSYYIKDQQQRDKWVPKFNTKFLCSVVAEANYRMRKVTKGILDDVFKSNSGVSNIENLYNYYKKNADNTINALPSAENEEQNLDNKINTIFNENAGAAEKKKK